MFYTNKSVRFIFLTIIALSLVLSLGRTQLVSAQSRDKVKYQLHSTNYALLGLPGSLDPTFDGDGLVTTTFGTDHNAGRAVAIQPDGKIVVAGYQRNSNSFRDFALARYNTDGSLDSSFGTNGKMITGFGYAYALDIAIQTDGKIVAAGYGYNNDDSFQSIFLARYNSNGTLDTSFDADGKVITGIGSAYALAIQSDGKLLVTGSRDTAVPLDSEIVLARYNTNGSLDTTFDSDGYLTTNPGSYSDEGRSIIIQPDGKILVGGSSYPNEFDQDYALIRYNADGSLDTSFSGDGIITTDFSNNQDYEAGIALQPDGKIIFAGSSYGLGPYLSVVLIRYNSNGSLDSTFDGDGKVSTSFAHNIQANDVALQSNGKIILAGVSSPNDANDFLLVRYHADGSLDTSFDTDGKVTTDLGSDKDFGHSISIQSDGNIVVAGYRSRDGTNNDFAVARYIGDQVAPSPSAAIQVNIAGASQGTYSVASKNSARKSYVGLDSGPVKVNSTLPIVASERVAYSPNGGTTWTSYSELMGLPFNQLATSYTFPWYNNINLNSQLRFGNAGTANTTVTVTIGGVFKGNYTLAPNASQRISYAGLDSGPVKVTSSGGVPIIASMRIAYFDGSAWTSFSEMMGLPSPKLTNSYVFPWYNNVDLNSQLRFGNVGTVNTNVTVTIGGVFKGTYNLAPNTSQRISYAGLDSGPVKVTSSGNVPIIASMRVAYFNGTAWTSFSEMMGMPSSSLSSHYSFPVYDNVLHNSQLRFGNVGTVPTTVTVTINGVFKGNYTLAPNASQRVSYPGLSAGPVVIQSSGNVPIIASERVAYFNGTAWSSFAEMMGLPQSQLSTTFLFPWYNNVDINTQLRFGVP